jgi:hypothetical protein
MCDRTTQSRVGLQRGFIDVVAAPLFRVAARLLPGTAPLLQQLEDNRRALDRFTDADMLAQVPPSIWPSCFRRSPRDDSKSASWLKSAS